jgi:hypothetical protein
MTGFWVSLLYVTVCVAVAEFPQLSVTVQVLVEEKVHPEPVSAPTVPVAVRFVLQLSVTDAVPKAAAISATVGLHTTLPADVSVIIGAWVSFV